MGLKKCWKKKLSEFFCTQKLLVQKNFVLRNVWFKIFWFLTNVGFKKHFGPKTTLNKKKVFGRWMLVGENVGSKKVLGPTKFRSNRLLVQQNFGSKIWAQKSFWIQKSFRVQKSFWLQKKFLVPKKFLNPKTYWV